MRLAYLSTDPGIPYGGTKGASVHVEEVVAALAAEGCEVMVYVSSIATGAPSVPGVTVRQRPGPGKGSSVRDRLAFESELADWLTAELDRSRPAALYERLALHSAAGRVAARRVGLPYLLEIDAPLRHEASRYRTLEAPEEAKRLERVAVAGADLVFAVSPPLVAYAAEMGARRVELLQNGAAVDRFPQAPMTGQDPVAVFAGSLRPWHGIETIAEAWRLLGSAAPELLVVGDGPARQLLVRVGAIVVGAVPPAHVPQLLAGADIGLAPYSTASPRYFSPIKLFEYLAAGLATVVADLPAVTEVVDADTAVVIPAGDAAALADAVATLCANAAERRRLGRNGRALVEARHTWTHRARRIIQAVGEVASLVPPHADAPRRQTATAVGRA